MKKKKIRIEELELILKVINQDVTDDYDIDSDAEDVMDCMEGKVSDDLLNIMKEMLLGFSYEMQLEIAYNLRDFALAQVIQTTGCMSADAVLKSCYEWIANEKGFRFL